MKIKPARKQPKASTVIRHLRELVTRMEENDFTTHAQDHALRAAIEMLRQSEPTAEPKPRGEQIASYRFSNANDLYKLLHWAFTAAEARAVAVDGFDRLELWECDGQVRIRLTSAAERSGVKK